MPGSNLRRLFVFVLISGLCMLPLASAEASQRDGGQKVTLEQQIHDLGRYLFQIVQQALGVSTGEITTTNSLDPFGSDGRGIDPNGVPRP
jgi:hypothetical protein